LWALREAGSAPPGVDLVVDTSVPVGAGVSSSAALICAVVLAGAEISGDVVSPEEQRGLLGVAVSAERDFVGARTGGLDQEASLTCRPGHALLIDFRDGWREHVPLEPSAADLAFVVVDTGSRHDNASGGYRRRRAECERVRDLLGIATLRDVDDLPTAMAALPDDVLRRRLQHVVTEMDRVGQVADLLRGGRLGEIGPALSASHRSLRDAFDVSSRELDLAVESALAGGALGARLVGGGFGGSVLALVPLFGVESMAIEVSSAFARAGLAPPLFLRSAPSGPAARFG
jgi:galactokinase